MNLSKGQFLILLSCMILVLVQGIWIFYDARKRNEKYYWLWGIFGLTNVPSSLIVYLLVTRVILNKNKKD